MFVDRAGAADKDDETSNKIKNKFRKVQYSCDISGETTGQPQNESLSQSLEYGGNNIIDLRNIDPRAVDAMLARELHQLSFQDREAVNEVRRQCNWDWATTAFSGPTYFAGILMPLSR
jgi:hypothetical protein